MSGWYGRPADSFQSLQQRTYGHLQEFTDWTQHRYRSIVDPNLPFTDQKYHHLYQRKSRLDLVRLSACVCGIEFCYAAETAFVSPTLLKIGIPIIYMTLIWCLSPAIGFFLVPFLGSYSDRCKSWMGRRRPFILIFSAGIVFGLALVPHGVSLGYLLGDPLTIHVNETMFFGNGSLYSLKSDDQLTVSEIRPIGVLLTIGGVMVLDLCADSCQSPGRAYLLDVCLPEDHARGLAMFTTMAGLGGGLGYVIGAIHWEKTILGEAVGGQEAAVFLIVLLIYLFCLAVTVTSFREMPLQDVETKKMSETHNSLFQPVDPEYSENLSPGQRRSVSSWGGTENLSAEKFAVYSDIVPLHEDQLRDDPVTLQDYLWSIVYMPGSLRTLCLTNLCCWMSLVCYSLYFTDWVGQAVFGGNPTATHSDSTGRKLYEEGVRYGCWGMAVYSVACSCYSAIIERLIFSWGAKKIYVGGQLVYTVGMLLMAATRNKTCVILFSATAGIMYSTLFTMPFFLVAHYHSSGLFQEEQPLSVGAVVHRKHARGLGTDIATVSSMVFLAQFILSILNGSIVHISGTPTATVILSAVLSFCGALLATRVTYVNL